MNGKNPADEVLRRMLDEHLGPALSREGWRRRSSTWYREGRHGYALINVQKRRFSSADTVSFCVNVGTYFPALVELERGTHWSKLPGFPPKRVAFPPVSRWHGIAGGESRLVGLDRCEAWWEVTASTSPKELFDSVWARWQEQRPDVDQVTDLGWESRAFEGHGMILAAVEYALAVGDVARAQALLSEAPSGGDPRIDEWAETIQRASSGEDDVEGPGVAPRVRGYIEYLGEHKLGTKRADQAWSRVATFLAECTDAGEPREAVLRIWDGAAQWTHEEVAALDGKTLAEMAPYHPPPVIAEAFSQLGPGTPHQVDGGFYFEWEAEPERDDFAARWRGFRDFVVAHDGLAPVNRSPVRGGSARSAAIELELRHRFRFKLPGSDQILPFQEPTYYLDEWVAYSQLTTRLGDNRVLAQFNFPFEQAGEQLAALWRAVTGALTVKLRYKRLRLHEPNRDGTSYRVRKLADFEPESREPES